MSKQERRGSPGGTAIDWAALARGVLLMLVNVVGLGALLHQSVRIPPPDEPHPAGSAQWQTIEAPDWDDDDDWSAMEAKWQLEIEQNATHPTGLAGQDPRDTYRSQSSAPSLLQG